MPGTRGWTLSTYGQDRLVMDHINLTDPFTQRLPMAITNDYSGNLTFQFQLVSPPAGYTNFSGISGGTVSGGLSTILETSWDRAISATSPLSETLTIGILVFQSSNYTGAFNSGSFSITNTTFNRNSGLIKVYGDQYSNDQPLPTLQLLSGTSMSGTYSYAISYVLSGWESDIGSPANIATASGNQIISISWASISGVAQYYVWRWSGSADFTLYPASASGVFRPMDSVFTSSTTSFNDTGPVLGSGYFRHRTWTRSNDGSLTTANTTTYLSAPQARNLYTTTNNGPVTRWIHSWQISRNTSGNLTGPWYVSMNLYQLIEGGAAGTGFSGRSRGFFIQNAIDAIVSGSPVVNTEHFTNVQRNNWYRYALVLPNGTSGYTSLQLMLEGATNPTQQNLIIADDVFIVAVS